MGNQEIKEVMWLRDLLPNHVQNARIATFSYLSDWYTYKKGVTTSLRELGEQLLNALQHDQQRISVRLIKRILSVISIQLTADRLLADRSFLLATAWVGW